MIKVDHDVYALFMAESPLHNRMLCSIITPRALPEKIGSSRVRPLVVVTTPPSASSKTKTKAKDMFRFSSSSSSSSSSKEQSEAQQAFSIDKLNLQSDDKRMTLRAQSIVGVLFSRKSNVELEKWFKKIVVDDDKNRQTLTNVMVFRGGSGTGKSFIVNWMSTKYGLKCVTFVPGVQHQKGIVYIIDHPDSKILDHIRKYYYESKTRITIIILVDFNVSLTPLVQSLVSKRKKRASKTNAKQRERQRQEQQKQYYELVTNSNLSFSEKTTLLQLTHRMDQHNDSISFVPSLKEVHYFVQIVDDNLSQMIAQFKFWLCPTMESLDVQRQGVGNPTEQGQGQAPSSRLPPPPLFAQTKDSNLIKAMQSLISLVNHPSIHLLLPIWSNKQKTDVQSFPTSASTVINLGTSLHQRLQQFKTKETTSKKDHHFSQIADFLSSKGGGTGKGNTYAFASLISFLIHWIAQIEQNNCATGSHPNVHSNVIKSLKEVMTIMMRHDRCYGQDQRDSDLEMDAHVWTRGVMEQVSKHVYVALSSLTNSERDDGKPPRLNWSQVMKTWTQFFRFQQARIDRHPSSMTVDELYHAFPT
jgi:hypothetical protein